MRKMKLFTACIFAASMGVSFVAAANETTGEKIQTGANKAGDSVKETYRNAKGELCELVNGKMECAAKQMKYKAQNTMDRTKTKAKELKNKVD